MSGTVLKPKIMCKIHLEEEVSLICESKECNLQTFCLRCMGKHKGHLIEPLKDFIFNRIQKTTQILDEIKRNIGKDTLMMVNQKKKELFQARKEIEAGYSRILIDITTIIILKCTL